MSENGERLMPVEALMPASVEAPSDRQRMFLRYFTGILIDLVVLNLFDEYSAKVFVDTFTVALVQLQPLMSVEPGPGVVFFMAVVILTVIAVQCFDPRLIWDAGRGLEVSRA